MESFDSLLTCCICLDRYRNPKLLPCQHTFCMEPCMEGLIDYVKRQVKCPECRAEHRIPYKGIQEFPSNVTMQRFLDMYQAISGEMPDPTQGQIMERCQVCNEKEYLQPCAHCDKKICPDCKSAHIDVLKRELMRINNQVRRGLHRLQDIHRAVDKNANTVQQNCVAVREEVENIGQRLIKAIRDRTEYLKAEVDSHMANEVRNLNTLKSNLEQEIGNIESNADLAEKHLNDQTEWDDCELTDAKDIFLKTVEFIRNFEHEAPTGGDFRRPVRFSAVQDPNSLSKTLEHFGELNIGKKELPEPGQQVGGFPALMPPGAGSGPGLMRSKSDHRLVSQLRQQDERGYGGYGSYGDESGRSSPVARRRFGERPARKDSDAGLYGEDSAYDSPCERRHKYRSRFTRRNLDPDDDMESYRPEPYAQHAADAPKEKKKEREKVLDTDDATKGPLSGIARIMDVPKVLQKMVEAEKGPKKKKEEVKPEPPPPKTTSTPAPAPWRRQKSEDDEISKIKKMNQEADARCSQGATPAAAESPAAVPRAPSQSRASAERRSSQPAMTAPTTAPAARPRPVRDESGSETDDSARRRTSRVSRPASDTPISEWVNEPFETPSSVAAQRRIASEQAQQAPVAPAAAVSPAAPAAPADPAAPAAPAAPVAPAAPGAPAAPPAERAKRTPLRIPERRLSRSRSTESTSSESSEAAPSAAADSTQRKPRWGSQPPTPTTPASPSTPATPKTPAAPATPPTPASPSTPTAPADPARERMGSASSAGSRPASIGPATAPGTPTAAGAPARPRFQSRFLGRAGTPVSEPAKESESSDESESESETESSSESESEEEAPPPPPRPAAAAAAMAKTSIGPLLARSAQARSGSGDASTTPTVSVTSRAGRPAAGAASGYAGRRESGEYVTPTTGGDRYAGRYGGDAATEPKPYESRYGNRYGADYGQGNGLTRSRTSSALDARPTAPPEDSYAAYAAKFSRPAASARPTYDDYSSSTPRYPSYTSRFLNRSKSSAALDAPEEATRPAGEAAAPGPAAAVAGGGRSDGTSRYAPPTERRSWLARSGSSEQTDERGSSGGGSSPAGSLRPSVQRQGSGDSGATSGDAAETASGAGTRSEALSSWAQYLKNKYGYKNNKDASRDVGKVLPRSKSSHLVSLPGEPLLDAAEPAVLPPPALVGSAAVLLGPRSQYMQKGRLRFKLGTRGGGPACFTWPRGIAVGPDNSIVVADSSNHRVQVFDQNGTFVKEFGQYGNGEGEFDCLAGVSVNRIGQFIISDRYNHRIQIFDPSGRFLRSFGQNGVMEGRFNYPWGVTTDALGFIYVCDKENHRVQVFQSDGTFVGTFGSEGRSSGQLAHPHYIAVSSTNRVVVTDSNNHRVQVFDVNGKCLTSFGGEGGEEGKFKFPRGVAVDDQGYIIVGDSGNNRIQVFEPDGTFLKAFGSWGSQDGEFKGLEGVAVMSNGNILVCDRENHRVQVF